VSGQAILSADNSGNPLDDRGSAPNPAGEAHSAPDALVGEEGGVAATSQEPPLALGLRAFGRGPSEKSWTRPDHLRHHWRSGGCGGGNAS